SPGLGGEHPTMAVCTGRRRPRLVRPPGSACRHRGQSMAGRSITSATGGPVGVRAKQGAGRPQEPVVSRGRRAGRRHRSIMSDALPTAARVKDPGLRALYRLENRWQAWLDVEVALARAQAELGIIPQGAATAIGRAGRLELLDRARIDAGLAQTGHTLVPLVWELARVVGEPHGGWVHWGATTQNIT